jgi:hypothetical protein
MLIVLASIHLEAVKREFGVCKRNLESDHAVLATVSERI